MHRARSDVLIGHRADVVAELVGVVPDVIVDTAAAELADAVAIAAAGVIDIVIVVECSFGRKESCYIVTSRLDYLISSFPWIAMQDYPQDRMNHISRLEFHLLAALASVVEIAAALAAVAEVGTHPYFQKAMAVIVSHRYLNSIFQENQNQ